MKRTITLLLLVITLTATAQPIGVKAKLKSFRMATSHDHLTYTLEYDDNNLISLVKMVDDSESREMQVTHSSNEIVFSFSQSGISLNSICTLTDGRITHEEIKVTDISSGTSMTLYDYIYNYDGNGYLNKITLTALNPEESCVATLNWQDNAMTSARIVGSQRQYEMTFEYDMSHQDYTLVQSFDGFFSLVFDNMMDAVSFAPFLYAEGCFGNIGSSGWGSGGWGWQQLTCVTCTCTEGSYQDTDVDNYTYTYYDDMGNGLVKDVTIGSQRHEYTWDDDPLGISVVPMTDGKTIEEIYSVDGSRIGGLRRGLNIVKMLDGTIQKVLK